MKIEKIVLIEPKAAGDHVYSTVRMPRLGLPLLGTMLKQKGYQVDILIGKGSSLPRDKVLSADLVGISTTTSTCLEGYRIANFLRSRGTPVVMGGIHVTFMPEEALQHCQYVVRGEAETSFLSLIEAIEEERPPSGIPGVSYWDNDSMVHNAGRDCWEDIDCHPAPDLTLLHNYNRLKTYPVMTSRGCPFNCSFCSVTPMFGRNYRYRDTDLVLDELTRYRGAKVFFVDDNFCVNRERTKLLLKGMLDKNIIPKWWGAQVRTDVVRDEEILDLMRRTNGKTVFVGLESINPETMKNYNKNQDVKDIERCIEKMHQYNIKVHGMFVFGGEGDTVQTIHDTVDFCRKVRVDTLQYLMLTPLPGTPLFNDLQSQGRLITRDWDLYDGHHAVFYPGKMSPQDLQNETIKAMRKFYTLPNLCGNVTLTGWDSALFRGVGWWLSHKWSRQNRWYEDVLRRFTGEEAVKNIPLVYRRVSAFKNKTFTPLKDNLLQIYLSRRGGVFHLKIKGVVNKVTLKALYNEVNRMVPKRYFDLVVKAEGIKFASDKTARRFSSFLKNLGERSRKLQVVCRMEDGLQRLAEKYVLSLPNFELIMN